MSRPKPRKVRLYMVATYQGLVSCETDSPTKARNLVGGIHGGTGKVRLATEDEVATHEGRPLPSNPYPEGYYCFVVKSDKNSASIVQLRDTMEKSPSPRERRLGYFLNGFPRFPWTLNELLEAGTLTPIKGEIRLP